MEIASPSLCIQCNITRQIGRFPAAKRWTLEETLDECFSLTVSLKVSLPKSSMNQLLIYLRDTSLPPPPLRLCDIVRAQCRMSIIVHQADFSTCLILPPSGNTLSLDLKREKAKFQVKPCSSSLDSRGRAFPLRKKKKRKLSCHREC